MCYSIEPPKQEMGFDTTLLKNVLEQFVDEIGEESIDLIEDRPRFAHAVIVVADDYGEMCQASCIRQLDDVILHETHVANVAPEWVDEDIQKALLELTASKEFMETPRNSRLIEEKQENYHHRHHHHRSTTTTTTTTTETSRNTSSTNRIDFPSMHRERSTSARRQHY